MVFEFKFKKTHPLEKRQAEARRIIEKYPDRIPIIVETTDKSLKLNKNKYLVPRDLTIGQFLFVIRKRLKITSKQAIFLFFNNTLLPTGQLISQIYEDHKDSDQFLYGVISAESTFG